MPPPADGLAPRLIIGPALRTQPDRRLVTLVREGYEIAFEEIVRRYAKPLGRYAASIVGGRFEDVTQDAFSKALLALRRNDAEIELRPWLFRIVRNTALNDLRDRPPVSELADSIPASRGPLDEIEQREELLELTRRLQALPDPQRAAIVMRELEGLGHDEIAAALGLTGGAARQAIYRARSALRDGLGMLLPLPLVKALLANGFASHAEAAGGVAGTAGASIALKATAATVLVAGTVGAGVALNGDPTPRGAATAEAAQERPGAATQAGNRAGFVPADDSNAGGSAQDSRGAGDRSGDGGNGHGPGPSGEGGAHSPALAGNRRDGADETDSNGRSGEEPGGHSGSGEDRSSSGSHDSGSDGSGSGDSNLSGDAGHDSSGDSSSPDVSSSGDGGSGDGSSADGGSSDSGGSESTDGASNDLGDLSGGNGLIQETSP